MRCMQALRVWEDLKKLFYFFYNLSISVAGVEYTLTNYKYNYGRNLTNSDENYFEICDCRILKFTCKDKRRLKCKYLHTQYNPCRDDKWKQLLWLIFDDVLWRNMLKIDSRFKNGEILEMGAIGNFPCDNQHPLYWSKADLSSREHPHLRRLGRM